MQWLKITAVSVAALIALSIVSAVVSAVWAVVRLAESLVVVLVLVSIVGLGLKARDRLRSGRNARFDARRSKTDARRSEEEQARAVQVRQKIEERVEADLERLKRETLSPGSAPDSPPTGG